MQWIGLLAWFGICFAVAGLGSWWTAGEITGWYRNLVRPEIAPPNGVFGPVWTLLYTLMAIAAWLVWQSPSSPLRSLSLELFLLQLVLNLGWSLIFFRLHALRTALAEILFLWATIGITTLVFFQIAPLAGCLMAPYWAWVTFAAILNAAFLRLNG